MKRNIIFGLLLSVAIITEAQAATINISNNCNQNVTVSAYSQQTQTPGYLMVEKLAYAHNSYTVTIASPVKCIATKYQQPGNSTESKSFYFSGVSNINVLIITHPQDSNACSISFAE